jgi:hypothetical protein
MPSPRRAALGPEREKRGAKHPQHRNSGPHPGASLTPSPRSIARQTEPRRTPCGSYAQSFPTLAARPAVEGVFFGPDLDEASRGVEILAALTEPLRNLGHGASLAAWPRWAHGA